MVMKWVIGQNIQIFLQNVERGIFKWLADGRVEVKANIGYVFLFFYGLERRIFVDAVENSCSATRKIDIVNEVIRLLELYGDNNSFKTYAQNFLSMELGCFFKEMMTRFRNI